MTKYPFRRLKQDLQIARVMVIMLLGIQQIDWGTNNYALYMGLEQVTKQLENPTRDKLLAAIVNWLVFARRLIGALPENEYRTRVKSEFDKLAAEYMELMEAR